MNRIGFPSFTTPLIGRDTDVQTIIPQLRRSPHRFTTLLGPSGTGKTRLSIQIADQLHADFPDGIAFISLATIDDPDLVIPTIARLLGIAERQSESYTDALVTFLHTQHWLFVLDNMEQVITATPQLVALLAQTPHVHLLVTSQRAAKHPAEVVIPVPALAIPAESGLRAIDTIKNSPAIALFVDRIRRVQPNFRLDQANASHVVDICRRLRGLPLAIELVAAHSHTLRPADLLLLLRNYLPVTSAKSETLTPEQVLYPVLTWCVAYSNPAIQWLLPRLGIFHGGWTLAQVQHLTADAPPILDLVSTLTEMVAKGLVLHNTASDEPTYTMLDAIRLYAANELQRNPSLAAACHILHATIFQRLAHDIDTGVRQGQAALWGLRMHQAMPNMRSAFHWLLLQQRYSESIQMMAALALPSFHHGYIREGLSWITRLNPYQRQTELPIQFQFNYANGLLLYAIGEFDGALAAYDAALTQAQLLPDREYAARVLNNQGMIYQEQNRYAQARHVYEEALAIRRHQAYIWGEATVLNNLGVVTQSQGDLSAARQYLHESLGLYEQLQDTNGQASLLQNLASTYLDSHDYAHAEALYRKSLHFFGKEIETSLGVTTLYGLGLALLRQAPPKQHEAKQWLQDAVRIANDLSSQRLLVIALEGFAAWLASANPMHAAYVLGGAQRMRDHSTLVHTPDTEAIVTALRATLDHQVGVTERSAAEARGAVLSREELVMLVKHA